MWAMLVVGAGTQIVVESVAPRPLGARVVAVLFVAAVLAVNGAGAARHRRLRWGAAMALLIVAVPLWFTHTVPVISVYASEPEVISALAPALLVFGTILIQLLRNE
jgi:hypothetical protein